ncbi:hypothetical protein Q5P01_008954 [Channa striata]|uniref:Cadherin domain-containing protein n=1 Tax=Channa striata TaxID=64152 RepID=A0AA88N2Z3_CHASR|nr:hypothetical protein Q5P01_008954 [Channa striata]
MSVNDPDSDENGKVRCVINKNTPFKIKSTSNNFYSLVTDSELDRETSSEYNITVTCSDEGVPSLSSSVTLTLQISDVNDNAPVFERSSYEAYIVENNTPGLSIFTVKATDADWNQNARVSYILEDSSVNGVPVSSYVSVSADSGVIHAVRSFDYEHIKDFQFRVKAQDGGSPPLSSNVTVKILIQDQNDNPPQVLYPVQTGGSHVAEMVPRSADVGYLVTKVVAVDVDSGQNAWLSYKLHKATDRALFEVGLQNGEIRTIRQVTDKDAVKQRLTVIVEDNGQPSRSATVIVNVAVADSFPEVLSEFTDFAHDKEYNDNLTFYLVLALAVVSFLFITCLVVIISVKIYRWRQSRILYHSSLPVIPYYPPRYSDTLGTGTLQHVYNYEVCRTTDSRKSDCKLGRAGSQNVLIMDPSSTGTMQRMHNEKSILDEPDSPLEISDVNDNAPVFERSSYEAYIVENNTPGLSIFTVKATDADWNQNARVSYILEDSSVNGVPVSSYVSVSADSGVIHAVRSFDYEHIKDFQFHVKAQDGGSPPLSSNVTVKILIQDQNDNPPQVLYPVQTGGSHVAEMVPRSADVGYLVTKVVAVDVDSGQNAWLSYKLHKASDRALFEVGLQNGEIRTIRQVTDKDAVKQRLTVIVEDNGQPSRSATVIVNVAVADSFPEVLSEFTDFAHDKEYNDNLTFYLVLALAVVSFLFITCLVVIISVKIYRWRQSRILYHSSLPVIPYYPPRYSDTLGTGTLQHVYNYEVCRTTDSRKSDCKLGRAGSQNVLIMDPSSAGTMQRIHNEKSILDEPDSPLESITNNIYSLVTDSELDRETSSEYNITVTCSDEGVPSLSSSVTLTLQISDVNDNAPVFERSSYEAYIVENNTPGLSIFTVKATDADWNQNARVSYILEDSSVNGVPVSSYVSVSADSGVIHAVRSFDYEHIKDFQFRVKAQDGGSPPLSSNVTVKILIQDQNDNPPQVLYPVQTGGSHVAEMVPRSADVGYLVTKVVAVDVDSGQNAWLSYKLHKATDRALFEVGLQNGEIRTIRQVTDKDAVKQRLTVIVEDNGQPSRSATVIVNVAVADSFPEVLSEFTDFAHDKEYNDNLTFYLVLALAVVSFLFITCLVVIISVKIYRWRQSRILYHSSLPVIPYYPPRYSDTLGTGTLQHVYNYEVCRTTDSRKSDSEDSAPGTIIAMLNIKDFDSASDKDFGNNARISYFLEDSQLNGLSASAYFSVNAESGEILAIRSFDYEQTKQFHIRVKAQDGGSPPLSSNVTVKILIQDQNDNPPQVLYPVQTGGSHVAEMVPRSADVGYLVTKVVAVDVDSGQNAWLSYKLHKATDRALFEVGLQNGEIRTIRQVTDKDAVKQRLTVIVEDNGQPSRSATVIVNVAVADSFPEVLSEFTDFGHDKEYNDNLTFYLVLALAVVSFLFITCLVVIISVKIYRWRRERLFYKSSSNLPVIPYYPPLYADVGAADADSGNNAKISYIILDSKVQDVTVSSYVYINSDNGSIYSMHSFDYEKLKVFQIQVQAKDQGSPSLSSNATVHVFILDQNDNAPAVIYPSSAALGSLSHQRMPRSAKAGHLVTKVTAVDADSGHNAWISYRLAEATDASLFTVNLYTGEVRTKRAVSEQDDSSQRLLIEIKDDGEPVQSSTVTVSILLEDGLHEPILDLRQKAAEPSKKKGRITLYLILSLASVSVLSLVTFLILAVKCIRNSRSSGSCCMRRSECDDYKNPNRNLQIQLNTDGPIKYVEVLGGDMLSQSQSFRSCMSPMSEYSDFTLIKPSSTTDFKEVISVLDASLPDSTWTFESQQPSYNVYLKENGVPGSILYSVSASDLDSGENAKISYSILDSKVQDVSVSSYVYINSDNGSIYSMHSFDYEKLKVFQIQVQAKDQGSPSLSSNATVHVFILDQNDNAPAVIYPSSAALGSLSHQRMPRSAKAGHLVTKDDSSQRLLIEIKDDGEPVQSSTVTVSILLEDGLHEPILDLRQKAAEPSKKSGRITLYLILSLASVSVLSLVTFLILAVKCIRNSRSSGSCCMRRSECDEYKNPNRNLQIQLNTDGPIKYVEVLGGDMLSQSQSFRSCMSPMSEYSDFTLIKPSSTTDFKEVISVLDASLPDSTWTFESQQQRHSPCFYPGPERQRPAVIYPSSAALGSLSSEDARSAKAGHLVTKVTAVDADSGHNAWISYRLAEATDASLFTVNLYTGEVRTKRAVSEQDDSSQRLLIEIKDDGEPVQSSTVTVSILLEDGLHEPILDLRQKAAEPSKKSGRITLYLILSLASVSVLSLVTFLILAVKCIRNSRSSGSCCMRRSECDDYKNPNRNLQIQLNTDGPIKYVEVLGGDMLSQSQSFRSCMSPMSEYSDFTLIKPSSTTDFKEVISVLDASLPDSTWTFESQQPSYNVYLKENGVPGSILYSVSASDLDSGENAKISYSILDSKVQDVSVSSYVYINSDNGSIYSMHSFDYEKLKVFQIQVQAKDQGSPSLSSNATVHVFILDQNDNAPAVIYPSSAALGSLSHQRMPRSAKAGHLVTKVTAVDADSGHNAWISYRLAEATDASLFTVNLYTGEVRTKRAVSEQDDSSQRLLIEIKDDGEPVQSSTVTVSILLEDGLHEPILDLRQKAAEPSKKSGRITLYLILSLASVSVLSLVTFLILAVKCIRNSRSSGSCCMRRSECDDYKNPNRNLQIQLNTDGPIKYVEVLGGDMLSQSQSFRSCMSPMSEYSDFTLIKPSSTTDFKEVISVLDASLPDSTWTFESQQVSP